LDFVKIEEAAMYYNRMTGAVQDFLPRPLKTKGGIMPNPTDEAYESEGWVVKPIVFAALPDGHRAIPDTRTLEYDSETKTATATHETELLTDYDARSFAERQAAKSLLLKQAENWFILVCDAIRVATGQEATQTKLGTYELDVALQAIAANSFEAGSTLAHRAAAMNAEVLAQGGTWADIHWHQEIAE